MPTDGKLESLESEERDSRQALESSNEPVVSQIVGKEKTVTFSEAEPLVGLVNNDNHRMIVPVVARNIPTKALIDTGAMNNMVHLNWLNNNSLDYVQQDVSFLSGFGISIPIEGCG